MEAGRHSENRSGDPSFQTGDVKAARRTDEFRKLWTRILCRRAEPDIVAPNFRRHAERAKLEILTSSGRADEIVDNLLQVARTSLSGDDGSILV